MTYDVVRLAHRSNVLRGRSEELRRETRELLERKRREFNLPKEGQSQMEDTHSEAESVDD